MTDIVGRFVPAHSDADEIERLRGDLAESRIAVANLEVRLKRRDEQLAVAEAEIAKRKAIYKKSGRLAMRTKIEQLEARLAEAEALLRKVGTPKFSYGEIDAFLAGEKHG